MASVEDSGPLPGSRSAARRRVAPVLSEPLDRLGKANLEVDTGLPAEFAGGLLGRDLLATKVTRTALKNAASVATLLLTSDALVAEKPKDDGKKGHGGDYDMY